jgi:hypothetical protein
MPRHRNIFIHGLGLTLRRLPAVLWTYVFNLGLALLFSIGLYRELGAVMRHSLAAQRLIGGFDLGIAAEAIFRITSAPGDAIAVRSAGVPLYLLLYFLLIPGTLFCYLAQTPARLSTLLHQGVLHFWRFVRITLITLFFAAIILGPLLFLETRWAAYIDSRLIGRASFFLRLAGLVVIFLVATLLRLYFDLVEVYTVQLGLNRRSGGKPDRRVRRTFAPAWQTFRDRFSEAWPIFVFLTLLGAAAVVLTARSAMHMLAQPRVWPMFLLAQLGLFLMLFTRFWQRGVEVCMARQNPILARTSGFPIPGMVPAASPVSQKPLPESHPDSHPAPIPDPEPISPSLDEPDPGVFHHTPTRPSD